MSPSPADFAWLPDHQLHVAETLAHVDETIDRLARLVHAYTAPPGALKLDNVFVNDQAQVMVTDIAPLPAAIPRLIADALTQLRAALEHTLFAEVEHRLGRHLSPQEARLIEMPACASTEDYRAWLAHRRRSLIPPLQNGAPLAHRIRDLQPFQRRDHADHPMRLLAEHTNVAKHRTPAVAAARLGPVYPDKPHPGLTTAIPFNPKSQPGDGLPLSVGDVIANGPGSVRTELSVVVTVSIRRPHTNVWNLVMKELEYLEDWVRTTAIPLLITGTRDVAPLPPHMDIAVGHRDLRCALQLAGPTSATQRARSRIVSAVALVEQPTALVEELRGRLVWANCLLCSSRCLARLVWSRPLCAWRGCRSTRPGSWLRS